MPKEDTLTPKEIEGQEDYLIYPDGRVFSKRRNKFLSPKICSSGYQEVTLCKNNKTKSFRINRLVALHFVFNDDLEHKNIVNHKDENKLNNIYTNLEWCTYAYNNRYGTKSQRIAKALSQKVIMCDKDTHEEIKTFNSMKEAAAYFNSNNATHIGDVLKGKRKTAYGFYWKKFE